MIGKFTKVLLEIWKNKIPNSDICKINEDTRYQDIYSRLLVPWSGIKNTNKKLIKWLSLQAGIEGSPRESYNLNSTR